MACIAGSVMPVFIAFGACPRFLFSAALMAGPGSLVAAKIMCPETQRSQCVHVDDLELPPSFVFFKFLKIFV
jgi:nucleoside permease NupC